MLKTIIVIELLVLAGAGLWLAVRNPEGASNAAPTGRAAAARDESGGSPAIDLTRVDLPELTDPSLVVDKSRLMLTVLDAGRPVKRYRVAVGGGDGDKVREGDRRTPEGEFYVCVKNPQSQYVLSLGLSYPDAADARRGLEDGLISARDYHRIAEAIRRRRHPPWDTPLGGEIMIHGARNGRDATAGCIALDDDDIRELYPRIDVGTPVRIVR